MNNSDGLSGLNQAELGNVRKHSHLKADDSDTGSIEKSSTVDPALTKVTQQPNNSAQEESFRMTPTRIADIVIVCLASLGAVLATIGVCGGSAWSDGDHNRGIWHHEDDYVKNEYQTTRAFSIVGALCAVCASVLAVIRLTVVSLAKSKSCRLAFVCTLMSSFLCLLTAIAVWGDFASHGINLKIRSQKLHLGWGFWVSVVADIVLFIANLIYLMRKDFKKSELQLTSNLKPAETKSFINK